MSETTTAESIQSAIDQSITISVRYHGGSQPGSVRTLKPMSIKGDNFRARCMQTGATKTFKVGKAEVLTGELGEGADYYVRGLKQQPDFQDIQSFAAHAASTLKGQGWHVQTSPSSISVHKIRKNGTPLKRSEVELQYSPMVTEDSFDLEADDFVLTTRESTRPYAVRSHTESTATFRNLDAAVERFWKYTSIAVKNLDL